MANSIVASAFVVLLLVSIVLSMPTDTFELPPYPDVSSISSNHIAKTHKSPRAKATPNKRKLNITKIFFSPLFWVIFSLEICVFGNICVF